MSKQFFKAAAILLPSIVCLLAVTASQAGTITGPASICVNTTNTYSVSNVLWDASFSWSISGTNSANASIVGNATNTDVQVVAGNEGVFELQCYVQDEATNEIVSVTITVPAAIQTTPLADQTVCRGADMIFATTNLGSVTYSYVWRKDGDLIPSATNSWLALTGIQATNAGVYCVEVGNGCGFSNYCALLTVLPESIVIAPSNLILQCYAEVPVPDTNTVQSTHAVTIFHVEDAANTNDCAITITRTYAGVNSCGATSTCAQVILIQDTQAPTLIGLSNLVVEVGTPWSFDLPSYADNCGDTNIILLISDTVTNPVCGLTYSATRTLLALDGCSNATSFTQTVLVQDTTPPAFAGLTNQVIEFGDAWDFIPPTATDNADGTNLTFIANIAVTNALCGNTYEATLSWTATDSCSNSASLTQTVLVQDTTPPAFAGLTNQVIEFGDAWDFIPPTATDNADGTNLTIVANTPTTNALCGNTFAATLTWTVTDSCSNSASFTQAVLVQDTTPPAFAGQTNLIFECGSSWVFQAPTFFDIADGTNVLLFIAGTTTNFLCGNTLVATQTWIATDSCSNTAAFTQIVSIVDTTPPVFAALTNRIVECGQAWEFDLPSVSDDLCGGTNVVFTIFNTITNPLVGETFNAERIWLATDACGNTNLTNQVITIIDTTPPFITTPTDIVFECTGSNVVNFTVSAIDGCDTNVALTVTPPSGSSFPLGTNTVTCIAADDSGNSATNLFLVLVRDTTPPQFVQPQNLIASEALRDSGAAAVTFASPTLLESCDSAPLLYSTPASGSVFPIGTNTVTWTAVDQSGNTNTCTFTIRVIPYRLFVTSDADDSEDGSLRRAILDSNDAPDENLINFALSGSGIHVINLQTSLPPITSAVTIDGWTQSSSNLPPTVELVGSSNSFDGLVIQSGRSIVRGLAFRGFDTALRLEGGTNVIQGNYVGVPLDGTNNLGNSGDGIFVASAANQIGGLGAATANLIGQNARNGIAFDGANARINSVRGNFIGLSSSGAVPFPNGGAGIYLTNGAAANVLGGLSSGAPNQIEFNLGAGIAMDITAGSGNSVSANSIIDNQGLGIDLGAIGPNPNDVGDADSGANGLLNYPSLSDARSAAGSTVIEGMMASAPNKTYTIQFFLNNAADPSGYGEGALYLGSTQVSTDATGTGNFTFSLALTALYTQFITATATDSAGNTSEFSPALQVRTPPVIESQPVSTNSIPGQPVTFCASASGTPPIFYQWRLNGVNIFGATNSCYTIPSANVGDGGTYSVIIGNELDAFATTSASLILGGSNILALPVGDHFSNAVNIANINFSTNGTVVGNNSTASLEFLEPIHAGKPGGRSVWYRWAPRHDWRGIATFRTSGSTFDTLLAVYQGRSVTNLTEIASDEDAGQFYSSEIRFNAFEDDQPSDYFIAVDALGGNGGEFVLDWNFIRTSRMLPVITNQPVGGTILSNDSITFIVGAVPQCPEGHLNCDRRSHWSYNNFQKERLTYQWFYENAPIPGATNTTLTIPNVLPENTGEYFVRVFTPWQYLDSRIVNLQIGSQSVQAVDKFIDALSAGALFVGDPSISGLATPNSIVGSGVSLRMATLAAGTVVRGYTGTQIFNTTGSAADPGEVICGVLGGSSEWITLVAEQAGTLFLNTDGSSYDTVMAVFARNPTNAAALQYLTCDNNSGVDGKDSSLALAVKAGSTNYIVVDGINGAVGTLYLNYSLATSTILKLVGKTDQGASIVQVNGRAGLRFSLQASTDFKNWTTVVTTNAPTGVFNYTDANGAGLTRRYYRALILP